MYMKIAPKEFRLDRTFGRKIPYICDDFQAV